MDRIAALISPPYFPLSLWHPPPNCRKMPKSAFKLKAIHLHFSDCSVNVPCVFLIPTNQLLCHPVELFIVNAAGWTAASEWCEQRWAKVESERIKCVNENWIKSSWISVNLSHCTEMRWIWIYAAEGGENKTKMVRQKKSLLISDGEQWQGSADLWTACHHLNIEPSVKSTHARTHSPRPLFYQCSQISAKQHVVPVWTVKPSLSISLRVVRS